MQFQRKRNPIYKYYARGDDEITSYINGNGKMNIIHFYLKFNFRLINKSTNSKSLVNSIVFIQV